MLTHEERLRLRRLIDVASRERFQPLTLRGEFGRWLDLAEGDPALALYYAVMAKKAELEEQGVELAPS
jgi:hypothetical protein